MKMPLHDMPPEAHDDFERDAAVVELEFSDEVGLWANEIVALRREVATLRSALCGSDPQKELLGLMVQDPTPAQRMVDPLGRVRFVGPQFFRDQALLNAELSSGLPLRLVLLALFTASNRWGYFEWTYTVYVKRNIMPLDHSDVVEPAIEALRDRGFLERVERNGGYYGFIPSFMYWQSYFLDSSPIGRDKVPLPDIR